MIVAAIPTGLDLQVLENVLQDLGFTLYDPIVRNNATDLAEPLHRALCLAGWTPPSRGGLLTRDLAP